MKSVQVLAEKLWKIICKCTLCSIQALQQLTKKTRELIYDCLVSCVQAIRNKTDQAFRRMKAFYDNLSEKLKDSMVEAKSKIDKICSYITRLVSDRKSPSHEKAGKLLSYLVKYYVYVKNFYCLAEEASLMTRNRCDYDKSGFKYYTDLLLLLIRQLKRNLKEEIKEPTVFVKTIDVIIKIMEVIIKIMEEGEISEIIMEVNNEFYKLTAVVRLLILKVYLLLREILTVLGYGDI